MDGSLRRIDMGIATLFLQTSSCHNNFTMGECLMSRAILMFANVFFEHSGKAIVKTVHVVDGGKPV